MIARWLWLVTACAVGTAHADRVSTRIEPAVVEPAADPAPIERVVETPAPAAVARARAATARARQTRQAIALAAKAQAEAATLALDLELRALTADPDTSAADIIEGTESPNMVTFTFDDGPSPDTTPAVLDALEKYDVPATFFLVTRRFDGASGERAREVLKRQLTSGFLVASHSVTHPKLRRKAAAVLASEIDESIRVLAREAARTIGMFRPPFGAIDDQGRAWLKKRGLTEVRWSIDPFDWKATDALLLRAQVLAEIIQRGGGVVLLHDVKPLTSATIAHILDDLEAENCARIANQIDPILPVSIHYFVRDNKQGREIPEAVKQRTAAYRAALPGRCAKRPIRLKPADPVHEPMAWWRSWVALPGP